MRQDPIARIEIDAEGRLHIVPSSETFPYIDREVMEVHWDPERSSLYSPPPQEWSYARWLQQILAAAREQGCELRATAATEWANVEPDVRTELQPSVGEGRARGEGAR